MSHQFPPDHDHEVDASAFFASEVGNLSHVLNLADALNEFGYTPDDRIERREICKMYVSVKADMEAEIHRLAHSNEYEAAKTMRARLSALRGEFDRLQTDKVTLSHQDQKKIFTQAASDLEGQLSTNAKHMTSEVDALCRHLQEDLAMSHAIQMENLELEISKIERPRVKYSKRAIELVKSETELIRLSQYDDARKVRRMLEKLLPNEETTYYKKYDAEIADKRTQLSKRQAAEWVRMDEKVKTLRWNGVRSREKLLAIGKQRIANHSFDMSKAHNAEKKLKPEMSVKPSASWQKRAGYHSTSAALRGDQLLAHVRAAELSPQRSKSTGTGGGNTEEKEDMAVFAASLTDKHDFVDHTRFMNTYTL